MKDKYILLCVLVFIAVIIFYFIAFIEISPIAEFFSTDFSNVDKLNKLGVIGDSTAIINTMFSALAFGGVIITIIWQLKANKKQSEENCLNRFENVYFNMVQTFESIVEGLSVTLEYNSDLPDLNNNSNTNEEIFDFQATNNTPIIKINDSKTYKGRETFECIYRIRKENGLSLFERLRNEVSANDLVIVELQHYFRYMYRIIKYIDESNLISETKKYEYAAMFRALLSHYELILLYYDGLSNVGINFKELIEKYALLNNLNVGDVKRFDDKEYNNSAFDARTAKLNIKNSNSDTHSEKLNLTFLYTVIILPYILVYSIFNFWNDFVVDVILDRIPDNSPRLMTFMCGLVFLLSLLLKKHIKIYCNLWSSSGFLIAINIIIAFILACIFLHDKYEWYGYMGIKYVYIIPVTTLSYIAYFLYRRNKIKKGNRN